MTNRVVSIATTMTLLLATLFLFLSALAAKPQAQMPAPQQALPSAPVASRMNTEMCARVKSSPLTRHAYHNEPPTGAPPATLDPGQFTGDKSAFVAYSIAARIPDLLYQEPCYCPCDRMENHQSLLDCYTSMHAKTCHACQVEVFFIYQQFKAGKTAAEIREAMAKGDVWKLNYKVYGETHYSEYKQATR
jgi:hypothetical protein